MALDSTERLYLERQVTLARVILGALALVALIETGGVHARRSAIIFLAIYLGLSLGAVVVGRFFGEERFRIPLTADFLALGAFLYLTPSVSAFWFLFLFVVFSLATRGNERAMFVLVAAATAGILARVAWENPFGWQSALQAITADPSIEEIILSGGDPLSLTDARLGQLTDALRAVPHIRRLRLHTRTPIVLPERVDSGFLSWLEALPWPTVMVLHANHANEIDAGVRAAASRLRTAGATLLNQSVLLGGINDSVVALEALSQALWSAQVLPYYLHLLDRVRGTAHWEVPESHARVMMARLASRLPGYLLPRLVRESAGAPAKTIVASAPWDVLHSSGQFE